MPLTRRFYIANLRFNILLLAVNVLRPHFSWMSFLSDSATQIFKYHYFKNNTSESDWRCGKKVSNIANNIQQFSDREAQQHHIIKITNVVEIFIINSNLTMAYIAELFDQPARVNKDWMKRPEKK